MTNVASGAVAKLRHDVGVSQATSLFGLARSTYYCERIPIDRQRRRGGGVQPNALTADERRAICEVLHTDANVDKTPYDIHASLLDEGKYLA